MTGPPPSLMSPSCVLSIVGQSVACVTSTATPTCGLTPYALVIAPRRPISSCTVETAYSATFRPPRFFARRSASTAHPQAGLVVHAGRVGQVVAHFLVAELERHRIADRARPSPLRPGPSRRYRATAPFVFTTCLRSSSIEQVNRLAGDDGRHRAVGRVDRHPLADELLRIPAADRVRVDVAVLVDVRDDQADLVGVAGEHHAQRRVRIATGDDVAVQVGAHVVGEIGDVLPHDFLHRLLVAGGAGRFENVFEKLLGGAVHGVVSVDRWSVVGCLQ